MRQGRSEVNNLLHTQQKDPDRMSAPTSSSPATALPSARSAAHSISPNDALDGAAATGRVVAPRELPTWQLNNATQPSRRAELVKRVEDYARAQLSSLSSTYTYHSLEHTEQIVNNSNAIADAEGLDADLRDLLIICAWMHD